MHNHVIAILAQWALKLKIVARAPIQAAERSLAYTSSLISTRRTEAKWNHDFFNVKAGDKSIAINVADPGSNLSDVYFFENWELRNLLQSLFTSVLNTLQRVERSPNPTDCFETCVLVYPTGLDAVTTLLTSDRHGDIQTSSTLKHISFCHSIYELLKANTSKVKEAISPPRKQPSPYVTLKWSEDHPQKTFFEMDQLISLLVPISLMTPACAIDMSGFLSVKTLLSIEDERIAVFEPPRKGLLLEYIITTQAWQERIKRREEEEIFDPDIEQLSHSPSRHRMLDHAGNSKLPESITPFPFKTLNLFTRKTNAPKDYSSASKQMKAWKIAPTYIKVSCRAYVITMMAVAVVLVLGGLAVPFTVQARIDGVDPFQITLFTWIVAGFVLVVAKSRYVNLWPWHDFLKGKVVCTSLSDLSDVSGLNTQIILRYLLQHEYKTWLVTSGPYNGMFCRRCDPRVQEKRFAVSQKIGFSIDRPVALQTLFASGFVILKLASSGGEDLICLDGRKGAWDKATYKRQARWMTCRDFKF